MIWVFDIGDDIDMLQRDLIRMSNQDYDLDEIIYQYLEYRTSRDFKVMRPVFSHNACDQEDAEILYLYTMRLYREIDYKLRNLRMPITGIRLTTDRKSLLVET